MFELCMFILLTVNMTVRYESLSTQSWPEVRPTPGAKVAQVDPVHFAGCAPCIRRAIAHIHMF